MTHTLHGRLATVLLLAATPACSPLFERADAARVNRLDAYLDGANVDRTDARTPTLIGYGRALDAMLASDAPVASFVAPVSQAQQCFLLSYGNRAQYRGGAMVEAMIEGRERRWEEYVRLSSSTATTMGGDPCRY